MRKVKVSFNGKLHHETWDVDQIQQGDAVDWHLNISRGGSSIAARFENNNEARRFNEGIALCRAQIIKRDGIHYGEKGAEIYLSGF